MPWYLHSYVYKRLTTVRSADYRQMPTVAFQLSEICLILPPTLPPVTYKAWPLNDCCCCLNIHWQNASSIIGNRRYVKAQIPSSGLLPRSIALSYALLLFHRLWVDQVSQRYASRPEWLKQHKEGVGKQQWLPFTKRLQHDVSITAGC